MSTYSTNLGIELITNGTQAGVWGSTTNTNLGTLVEQAISGYQTQAVTGGTDTITMPNGATGVARNMFLELTGTGGGNLVVPAKKKLYFIYNNTSSGGAVTVKVSGQTGVAVPFGAKILLVCDGTDVEVATSYMAALTLGAALPVTSGGTGTTTSTGTGNVVLSSSPSVANPTLTGTPIAPTAASGTNTTQLATTAFVQTAVSALLPSGTALLFNQTTAPTGWTKSTTHNNKALRVVSGTVSSGGTVAFTTAFASQTPSGSVSVSGTVGATTLDTTQIPSHTHAVTFYDNLGGDYSPVNVGQTRYEAAAGTQTTSSTGGGGSHTHSFSGSGSFTGAAIDLAVQYVDVIIATKD
jgi:hypothetical protein